MTRQPDLLCDNDENYVKITFNFEGVTYDVYVYATLVEGTPDYAPHYYFEKIEMYHDDNKVTATFGVRLEMAKALAETYVDKMNDFLEESWKTSW